jgi:translation initiation factor IF-2
MTKTPATTEASKSMVRPPIVVVMGHVDHGKTTLLDTIRKSNVAAREAGGITQSIGAYEIEHGGRKMTFIDTPGHEAFSKMRSRGARIADLAILVVAADEGVKPQTQESIKTLEETKTPFVVAITKTDKEGADLEKVKNDLMSANVFLEGSGGTVSFQPVSAKSGEHVDELLDLLLLAVDLEPITYDPSAPASGFVLEARVDHRRGLEATVIVTNGTLRQGDAIATKSAPGRVKILENFLGKTVKEVVPSAPALLIGFERLPQIGEAFSTSTDADTLEETTAHQKVKPALTAPGDERMLRVVLKTSDAGSLEALYEIMRAIGAEKPLKIVGDAVGDVNDNDVKLAVSAKAMIIAFGSRVDKAAKTLAEANKVTIVSSEIIYDLVTSIGKTLDELAKPSSSGGLEVLAVFNITKLDKQVVGGRVAHGTVRNRAMIEIVRDHKVVAKGRITNLQQQKKDISAATEGEAGLMVSSQSPIMVGDMIVMAAEE